MSTLDDEVRSVVESFMNSNELFTALDVSNKVKMTMPFARHREIRDIVRAMFTTDIETAGWARTPITVTLGDGSTAEALLYHPVSDAWDLDNKYDMQKRTAGTVKAAPTPQVVQAVVTGNTLTPAAPIPTPAVAAPVVPPQVRDQWAAMFGSAPSLFPRK